MFRILNEFLMIRDEEKYYRKIAINIDRINFVSQHPHSKLSLIKMADGYEVNVEGTLEEVCKILCGAKL